MGKLRLLHYRAVAESAHDVRGAKSSLLTTHGFYRVGAEDVLLQKSPVSASGASGVLQGNRWKCDMRGHRAKVIA